MLECEKHCKGREIISLIFMIFALIECNNSYDLCIILPLIHKAETRRIHT